MTDISNPGSVSAERVAPEKILFVIDHFRNPHAGTEGQLFALVNELDRSRFEPLLLVFTDSDYLRENGFPCPYHVLGQSRLASPGMWWSLFRLGQAFRAEGVRLAHVFFNDPSIVCPPIFHACGIRTIISRRDMGYWYTRFHRFVLPLTGRFVSGVVTNSHAVKAVTEKVEKYPEHLVHVIYNGYPERIEDSRQQESVEPITPQLPAGAIIAILVANIRPIKRMGDAIRALALAAEECDHLHLVVVGDGNASSLFELAEQQGIGERVHFTGPRQDVTECLRKADIGVLCSESEGFSNAVVEYLRAGLPVVCSSVGGNPEAVTDGEEGFLFPVGDVKALAERLKWLSLDSDLRHRLGKRALRSGYERFSMRVTLDQHQALYDQVLLY
jgi:glycosyltransferase involved in cell wall biosynthesis